MFAFILVPTGNLYNIYSCHVQSNLFWVFTEPMPESAITNATKKATEFPKRKRFLLHVCFGAGQILLAKTLENFSLPYSLLLDYSTFEFYYPTLPYPTRSWKTTTLQALVMNRGESHLDEKSTEKTALTWVVWKENEKTVGQDGKRPKDSWNRKEIVLLCSKAKNKKTKENKLKD